MTGGFASGGARFVENIFWQRARTPHRLRNRVAARVVRCGIRAVPDVYKRQVGHVAGVERLILLLASEQRRLAGVGGSGSILILSLIHI